MADLKNNILNNNIAGDTSNILAPDIAAIQNGIEFKSNINSNVLNGYFNVLSEAVQYLQFTGGLYSEEANYNEGNIASLVIKNGEDYSIWQFRRNANNPQVLNNNPPIAGASITTVNGVDAYEGGSLNTDWDKLTEDYAVEATPNTVMGRDGEGASNVNMPSSIRNTTVVNNQYLNQKLSTKQEKLKAGANIDISEDNVISATGQLSQEKVINVYDGNKTYNKGDIVALEVQIEVPEPYIYYRNGQVYLFDTSPQKNYKCIKYCFVQISKHTTGPTGGLIPPASILNSNFVVEKTATKGQIIEENGIKYKIVNTFNYYVSVTEGGNNVIKGTKYTVGQIFDYQNNKYKVLQEYWWFDNPITEGGSKIKKGNKVTVGTVWTKDEGEYTCIKECWWFDSETEVYTPNKSNKYFNFLGGLDLFKSKYDVVATLNKDGISGRNLKNNRNNLIVGSFGYMEVVYIEGTKINTVIGSSQSVATGKGTMYWHEVSDKKILSKKQTIPYGGAFGGVKTAGIIYLIEPTLSNFKALLPYIEGKSLYVGARKEI